MTRNRGRRVGFPPEALPAFVRVAAGMVVLSLALAACESADSESSPTASASTPPSTRAAPGDVVTVDVLATIPVGVDPGDVAVDPAGETAFVTNSGDGTVSVIDTGTREVAETITVGGQPGGLAVDPAEGLIYVTSDIEGVGSVSVIDGGTRRVIDTISIGAGTGPGEVALDPRTHSLIVANTDETVSIVDTQTRELVETLSMPGHAIAVAVDTEKGAAFVSSGGTVTVIDTATRRISATVEWGGAAQLAVDSTVGLLFVANEAGGTVSVFDTATHERIGTVRAGGPYGPFDLATDPTAGLAYVTGGSLPPDATEEGGHWLVAIIDIDTLEVVETITWDTPSLEPSLQLAVDPATDSVYLAGVDGTVTVIARR